MKLGRIELSGVDGAEARLVLVLPGEQRVVDLKRAEVLRQQARGATPEAARRYAQAVFPGSMAAAIALGDQFTDAAHDAAALRADDASLDIGAVKWLAASDPSVVRDGLTFITHIRNFHQRMERPLAPSLLDIPGYFKGSPWTVIGHDAEVPFPGYIEHMDYELEIGWVIGRRGHNLRPEEARKHLFGVTIFNDFSGRNLQASEMPIGMGPTKSKDFAYGIGPWITTADEFERFDNIAMSVKVNGEVWGRGTSENMLWSIEELIAYVSLGDHIQPGDVIGSGTVGNGSGLELGRKLAPGDVVELEVGGVGVLRNRIGPRQEGLWWPTARKPFM